MSDANSTSEERIAIQGPDGKFRCRWPGTEPLYLTYHDTAWGVPDSDSRALWEKHKANKNVGIRPAFEDVIEANKVVHMPAKISV